MRAYNDWAAEFNAVSPDRLVVLALLPSHSPESARVELARCAELGHRGAILDLLVSDEPAFEDAWEGFWATANELALPISFHLGKGMHSIAAQAGKLAPAGRGRGVAAAARRDAHRHDLLRHPRALPERAHRAR